MPQCPIERAAVARDAGRNAVKSGLWPRLERSSTKPECRTLPGKARAEAKDCRAPTGLDRGRPKWRSHHRGSGCHCALVNTHHSLPLDSRIRGDPAGSNSLNIRQEGWRRGGSLLIPEDNTGVVVAARNLLIVLVSLILDFHL